jgi:ELWxxDGT repeat protein
MIFTKHSAVATILLSFVSSMIALRGEQVAAQTVELVANINDDVHNEPTSSNPSGFTVFDGELYFAAFSDTMGSSLADRELWKTDGTTHTRVADINPGISTSSNPNGLTVFNDELYFAATSTNGRELWKTNGTITTEFADINFPGPVRSSSPSEFTRYAGELYFAAQTDSHGREVWNTDGTILTEVSGSSDPHFAGMTSDPTGFTVFNGELYFAAYSEGSVSSPRDRELWKTNGTTTTLLADINPGRDASSNPNEFTVFNGEMYFAATSTNGRELWKTNGVTTTEVVDLNFPGPIRSSDPSEFTIYAGELYFAAQTDSHGRELWKTDGTAFWEMTGSSDPHFTEASSDPTELTLFNGELYFAAYSDHSASSPRDRELWKTDGTTVTRVADINPGVIASSNPDGLTVFNGELYFAATSANGRELWKTDGITTNEVANIAPGPNRSSNPGEFIIFNGDLYFAAEQPDDEGRELWRVVGVPEPSGILLLATSFLALVSFRHPHILI